MLILHIEDDYIVVRVVEAVARNLGYKVITAGTLAQGRELAMKHTQELNLILTDIHLPDGNGLTLVTSLHSELPNIPIIASSTDNSVWIHDQALQAGCIEFVAKNPDFMEILPSILKRYERL